MKRRWRRYGLRWSPEPARGHEWGFRERWFWTGRGRKHWARSNLTARNLATWHGRPW